MVRDPKRRRQLLEAALGRFSAEGYEAATTRSIATDAGVSEVVLFRHFPSKHDLFLAVVAELGPKELFRHVPAAVRPGESASAGLRSLVIDYLDTTWTHRAWLKVLFQEAGRNPEAAKALAGQYRGVGEALQAIFREGVARGEFREEMAGASMQVMVLAVRGFVSRSAARAPADWGAVRDEFVSSLMSVIAESLRPAQPDRRESASDGTSRRKQRR
jgi:AcrR family transcriptional regulator